MSGAEPSDTLGVAALAGMDRVDASALGAGLVTLTAHGGTGNDTLIGSAGDDLYFGGIGDDRFEWGQGNDVFEGEAGPTGWSSTAATRVRAPTSRPMGAGCASSGTLAT